jgi:hypothetical protein
LDLSASRTEGVVEDIARLVVVVASSLPFGIVVGGESVAVLVVIAGVVESGTMRDGDGSIAGSLPFDVVVGVDSSAVRVVVAGVVGFGVMRDGMARLVVAGSLPFPTVVGGDGAFVLVVISDLVESGTMRDGDGSCVVSFPLYAVMTIGAGVEGTLKPKSFVNISGISSSVDLIGSSVFSVTATGGLGDAGGLGDGDADGDGGRICRSGFSRCVSCLMKPGAIAIYIACLRYYVLSRSGSWVSVVLFV